MTEMQAAAVASKRPTAITVICLIGFFGLLASAWLFASGALAQMPDWYAPYLAVSVILGGLSMVGLWLMRKWGFYLYAGVFVANQVIMLATGLWTPTALVLPLIVVIVAFFNLDKMR
jgi:hypothetical protein